MEVVWGQDSCEMFLCRTLSRPGSLSRSRYCIICMTDGAGRRTPAPRPRLPQRAAWRRSRSPNTAARWPRCMCTAKAYHPASCCPSTLDRQGRLLPQLGRKETSGPLQCISISGQDSARYDRSCPGLPSHAKCMRCWHSAGAIVVPVLNLSSGVRALTW